MTKSKLIIRLIRRFARYPAKDVEASVKAIYDAIVHTLHAGKRIEIRGFGSFSVSYRGPRVGRNPKSGETVRVPGKYAPHFKPGKDLRERVSEPLVGASARNWGD